MSKKHAKQFSHDIDTYYTGRLVRLQDPIPPSTANLDHSIEPKHAIMSELRSP